MSIKRFQCIAEHVHPGYTVASMRECERGGYVSYTSHTEELRRVQSELDALKEALKRQIFAPLEKAMMNALIKTAISASETVYTVNPCNKLTAERVREVVESNIESGTISIAEGETFIKDAIIHESLVKCGSMNIGGSVMTMSRQDPEMTNAESGFMTRHVLAMPEQNSLLCIKSEALCFVAGNRYECETKGSDLFLAQDEFVSDLHEDDFWRVTDGGAYYIVETVVGNAYFKK